MKTKTRYFSDWLQGYLAELRVSNAEFSRLIKETPPKVGRWINGQKLPDIAQQRVIAQELARMTGKAESELLLEMNQHSYLMVKK